MYIKKDKSILLLILVFTFVSCESPLEKKYNRESFSQDLSEMTDENRVIIKNIINAYESDNSINNIAGNERVLIPSLTFNELRENYNRYHSDWRTSKKMGIKSKIKSKWVNEFNSSLMIDHLNQNTTIILHAKKVHEPKTDYISREITLRNNFNNEFQLINGLITDRAKSPNRNIGIGPTQKLSSGDKQVYLINDFEFETDQFKPRKDEKLKFINYEVYLRERSYNDLPFPKINIEYTIRDVKYSSDSYSTLLELGDEILIDKLNYKIDKVDSLVNKEFEITLWPYNSSQVRQITNEIINNKIFNVESNK